MSLTGKCSECGTELDIEVLDALDAVYGVLRPSLNLMNFEEKVRSELRRRGDANLALVAQVAFIQAFEFSPAELVAAIQHRTGLCSEIQEAQNRALREAQSRRAVQQ